MKIRYTIIVEEIEDPKDWEASSNEEMLKSIKDFLESDPGYLSDSTWKSVTVEEIL